MRGSNRHRLRTWLTAAVVALVAMGYSRDARAEGDAKDEWEIEGHFAYEVLGGHRPTGGIMPTLEARYVGALSEVASWTVGVDLGVFGLSDASHWIGVLGGPTVGVRGQWRNGLGLGLAFNADFGRLPVCNDWDLCLRYIGFFPALVPSVTYATESHISFGIACPLRYVNTLGWEGIAFEPAVLGRVFF